MFITISHTNPDPLYKQVTDQMKHAIMAGILDPGQPLPSIRALAKELKISVITIKRAYADLEQEGFIFIRPGLGSFVSEISKKQVKEEKMGEMRMKLKEIVEVGARYDIKIRDLIKLLEDMEEEGI